MRKHLLFGALLSALSLQSLIAQTTLSDLPESFRKDSFPILIEQCKEVLNAAYMAQKCLKVQKDIPGWEGYPVSLYEYYTGKDVKKGVPKRGLVYLLNPTPEKLATWIATTCWEVKHSTDTLYLNKLAKFIKWQSGAQFPVQGVVYEDMYTKGFYEPYILATIYLTVPTIVYNDWLDFNVPICDLADWHY